MQANSFLRPTTWLAKRLGLSVSTIERLRAQGSPDLPPSIVIGASIRYDELQVEAWLQNRLQPKTPQAKSEGDHHEPA